MSIARPGGARRESPRDAAYGRARRRARIEGGTRDPSVRESIKRRRDGLAGPSAPAGSDGLIKSVARGDTGEREQRRPDELALDLADRTDIILIACRELPLIFAAISVSYANSLDVLAANIIRFAA